MCGRAWLLVPNVCLTRVWGKVLFSVADIAAGCFIYSLVRQDSTCNSTRDDTNRRALKAACLWWFNPLVFTVSTRGSADVLVVVPVLG